MDTTSYHVAERMKNDPIQLPWELRQQDRQDLDDAVLELIGVADPKERVELKQRLYEEVTLFTARFGCWNFRRLRTKIAQGAKQALPQRTFPMTSGQNFRKRTLNAIPKIFLIAMNHRTLMTSRRARRGCFTHRT